MKGSMLMPNKSNEHQPLFKYEREEKDTSRGVLIAGVIAIFVCVSLYIAGILTANKIVIGVAFALAAVSIIVTVLSYRATSKNSVMTPEEIEEELRQYEDDVRRTFVGYDVDYDESDIEAAVAKRREELNIENTRLEINNPLEVAKITGRLIKEERDETKNVHQEYKNARKQRKEAKRAMKENKEGQ